jgi:hypothetical protein
MSQTVMLSFCGLAPVVVAAINARSAARTATATIRSLIEPS